MSQKQRRNIKEVPHSLAAWQKEFCDDLGYEVSREGSPVTHAPGSPEKIATIRERLSRGQALWHSCDSVTSAWQIVAEPIDVCSVVGTADSGAVVGVDAGGGKHRYACWLKMRESIKRQIRFLYITEHPTFVDSFERDDELYAIREHAKANGAAFVAVASVYSIRSDSSAEVRQSEYPVTGLTMLWLRWLARYCDRVVACWGEGTGKLSRDIDVLWMLSRTAKGGRVYISEEEKWWPQKLARFKKAGLQRYDYSSFIADRVREEEMDASVGD